MKKSENTGGKQLKLFAFRPQSIARDDYDIDVFQIYDELKKKYKLNENIDISKKNKLLSKLAENERIFIKFMKQSGVNLSIKRRIRHYILPSTDNHYFQFLGLKICD